MLSIFNPYALTRLPHDSPFAPLSKPQTIVQQAENIGWQWEQCVFLIHAPMFRQPEHLWVRVADKVLAWAWPQSAVVYGLVFCKTPACLTPKQTIHLNDLNTSNSLALANIVV